MTHDETKKVIILEFCKPRYIHLSDRCKNGEGKNLWRLESIKVSRYENQDDSKIFDPFIVHLNKTKEKL